MQKKTGVLSNQRQDMSILKSKFSVVCHRVKGLAFEAFSFTPPDVNLSVSYLNTEFKNIPLHGNKVEYSSFSLKFKVDSHADNYIKILNWIKGLGTESSYEDTLKEWNSEFEISTQYGNLYSDISVVPLSGLFLPNIDWKFHNAFPSHLSIDDFDNQLDDSREVTATVRFSFQTFDIKKIVDNPSAPFMNIS